MEKTLALVRTYWLQVIATQDRVSEKDQCNKDIRLSLNTRSQEGLELVAGCPPGTTQYTFSVSASLGICFLCLSVSVSLLCLGIAKYGHPQCPCIHLTAPTAWKAWISLWTQFQMPGVGQGGLGVWLSRGKECKVHTEQIAAGSYHRGRGQRFLWAGQSPQRRPTIVLHISRPWTLKITVIALAGHLIYLRS